MKRHYIKILLMMMVFPAVLLALASGDQQTDDLGWVVACEVFDNQSTASAVAEELVILTNAETGVLWIPDWLVYLGPFEESVRASEAACILLWMYSDAYAIHVGSAGGRGIHPSP